MKKILLFLILGLICLNIVSADTYINDTEIKVDNINSDSGTFITFLKDVFIDTYNLLFTSGISIGSEQTNASGLNSIAIGHNSTVSGVNSVCIGTNCINLEDNTFKINQNLTIVGNITISGKIYGELSNDKIWNITGSNYLINDTNILYLNETKLNETIISLNWNINNSDYLINDTGILSLNETKLVSDIITDKNISVYQLNVTGNQTITHKLTVKSLNVTNNLYAVGNLYVLGNMTVKRPHGMFSSNETETMTLANTPYPVSFNIIESDYQIIKTNDVNFTFQQQGLYKVDLSAIVEVDTPNKNVQLWVRKNGVDIPNSNTKVNIPSASMETLIVVPFIIDVLTTDVITIMCASNDGGSTLFYTGATAYSPATPSIIMTMQKISEITD